jgi:hypothetical protein
MEDFCILHRADLWKFLGVLKDIIAFTFRPKQRRREAPFGLLDPEDEGATIKETYVN